jgi:hypothetical protein
MPSSVSSERLTDNSNKVSNRGLPLPLCDSDRGLFRSPFVKELFPGLKFLTEEALIESVVDPTSIPINDTTESLVRVITGGQDAQKVCLGIKKINDYREHKYKSEDNQATRYVNAANALVKIYESIGTGYDRQTVNNVRIKTFLADHRGSDCSKFILNVSYLANGFNINSFTNYETLWGDKAVPAFDKAVNGASSISTMLISHESNIKGIPAKGDIIFWGSSDNEENKKKLELKNKIHEAMNNGMNVSWDTLKAKVKEISDKRLNLTWNNYKVRYQDILSELFKEIMKERKSTTSSDASTDLPVAANSEKAEKIEKEIQTLSEEWLFMITHHHGGIVLDVQMKDKSYVISYAHMGPGVVKWISKENLEKNDQRLAEGDFRGFITPQQ